jgi:hypothetical protein
LSAPLAKDACDALRLEQSQLEAGGARANMVKGPEWARANLATNQQQLIARLIEVDEGLAFRCGLARAPVAKEVLAKADAAETTEQIPGAEQEAQPAPPPAKPKRRETARKPQLPPPQAVPAAAPQQTGQPAETAVQTPPASAPVKKSAARKPKADDALKPSGPSPSSLDDQASRLTEPKR